MLQSGVRLGHLYGDVRFPHDQQRHYVAWCPPLNQVVAVVRGEDLWVANAGDSRCVCSRRGLALALSHDHKPTDEEELQRISRVRIPHPCPSSRTSCGAQRVRLLIAAEVKGQDG